jgi:hypothetical protein
VQAPKAPFRFVVFPSCRGVAVTSGIETALTALVPSRASQKLYNEETSR